MSDLANELYPVGADRVYVADDDRLAEFALEPWLKVLSDLFAAQAPEFVMFGATPIGEALAPRLAQRFGAGLIVNALMLKVDDFDRCFIGRRAAYGGEYYEVMTTAGARSHFATVLPDTFGAPYPDASRYGEVETVEVNLDDVEAQIKTIGPVEFTLPQPKLKSAKQIVSVGRQVGDIDAAKSLAETLGAELAGRARSAGRELHRRVASRRHHGRARRAESLHRAGHSRRHDAHVGHEGRALRRGRASRSRCADLEAGRCGHGGRSGEGGEGTGGGVEQELMRSESHRDAAQ